LPRRILISALALAFAVAGGCKRSDDAFEIVQVPGTPAPLQPYWKIPDFSLTERTGQPLKRDDLAGKVWVADFFYTTCPGPCPMLSSRLSEVQKALGGEKDLRLVSISTDPEKDTPEVLKLYAERFQATDHWFFLTGPKDDIFVLARDGFKLPIAEAPGPGEQMSHSTRLILVDRQGMIRGFYEALDEASTAHLVRDIRTLLAEK
jgi:cytochrome oxidase Cu insertion factor (SCO1/SenC/PrrC family)